MALPAGVESGVFCSQRLAGLYIFAFTALTVWGGGLCLAKLDTDAAARRKQPGLPKEEKKTIKAQTHPAAKRACWRYPGCELSGAGLL